MDLLYFIFLFLLISTGFDEACNLASKLIHFNQIQDESSQLLCQFKLIQEIYKSLPVLEKMGEVKTLRIWGYSDLRGACWSVGNRLGPWGRGIPSSGKRGDQSQPFTEPAP